MVSSMVYLYDKYFFKLLLFSFPDVLSIKIIIFLVLLDVSYIIIFLVLLDVFVRCGDHAPFDYLFYAILKRLGFV